VVKPSPDDATDGCKKHQAFQVLFGVVVLLSGINVVKLSFGDDFSGFGVSRVGFDLGIWSPGT